MRTTLRSNSQSEATRGPGRCSNPRQEQRNSLRPAPAIAPPGDIGLDEFPESEQSPGYDEETASRVAGKPGIVIIHHRTVFRDCLAKCLGMAYVDHDLFSASSIAEWLACEDPKALDVAVVIVVIDGLSESSAADLECLETGAVTIPVIIISDIDDLNHIVRALKSGVRGYIPTSLSFNVAIEAVRLVKAGGIYVPASSILLDGDAPPQALNRTRLTERQLQVIERIRCGKANKQIAYELNMSEHTVKIHLRHIMRKLGARNRTEVAVLSEDLLAGSGRNPHLRSTPSDTPDLCSAGNRAAVPA